MRLALVIFMFAALFGCAETRNPTGPAAPPVQTPAPEPGSTPTPPPPPTASGWVWVMVVEESGICIDQATVRVIAGQQLGASREQDGYCDAWWVGGVVFQNLVPGEPMTLRVSAPRYLDVEITVIPATGAQRAVLVTPPPA